MSVKQRILAAIKRIAYQPTRTERQLYADAVLQQITAMLAWDRSIMAVASRRNAPGVVLAFNPNEVSNLTAAELTGVLVHETQHILANDQDKMALYAAMPWPNGWEGGQLFNVARDCQINDQLCRLGVRLPRGAAYGETLLERNTERDEIVSLMHEIAEKVEPPPAPEDNDLGGTGELSEAGDDELEKVEMGSSKKSSSQPASAVLSEEQARWENFLATILDTKQTEDRWHQQPKRLSGVSMYMTYETVLPRRSPLPRKTALMAIDVSGSMDERGVAKICALVRNSPANYALTVICFDDGCAEWENFRSNDQMPRRGGGTDFGLVETYAKGMRRYPDAILCITDGDATIPVVAKPSVWTWILYGADAVRFGEMASMRAVDLREVIR